MSSNIINVDLFQFEIENCHLIRKGNNKSKERMAKIRFASRTRAFENSKH